MAIIRRDAPHWVTAETEPGLQAGRHVRGFFRRLPGATFPVAPGSIVATGGMAGDIGAGEAEADLVPWLRRRPAREQRDNQLLTFAESKS